MLLIQHWSFMVCSRAIFFFTFLSYRMWRRFDWWICTDVSEEPATLFFMVEEGSSVFPLLFKNLSTKLHGVTSQKIVNSNIIVLSIPCINHFRSKRHLICPPA